MKTMLAIIITAAISAISMTTFAVTDECVKANPNKVDDVQRCLSRISNITSAHGGVINNPNGCYTAKTYIAQEQGNRYNATHANMPSCRVIGDALARLNGNHPTWYACVDYDGSQKKLNKCVTGYFPLVRYNNNREANCQQLRQQMVSTIPNITDSPKGAKAPLTCEMLHTALQANGWNMTASECLGYKPDSAGHMERCLYNTLTNYRYNGHQKPTCDAGRQLYEQLVQTASASRPGNYVVPTCATMDNVISRIYTGKASAPDIASAPASTSRPEASDVNELPAPAAIPAASERSYTPATQSNYEDSYQSERERRRAEKERKAQEKLEKVNDKLDTARQVKELFKGFGL